MVPASKQCVVACPFTGSMAAKIVSSSSASVLVPGSFQPLTSFQSQVTICSINLSECIIRLDYVARDTERVFAIQDKNTFGLLS